MAVSIPADATRCLHYGDGNRVTVGSGAGFDAMGRFLVLPGEGASLTVPGGSSASCYVHLLFPNPAPVGEDGTTLDLAAALRIGDTDEVPDNGVLLAEIRRDAAGVVAGVVDRRQPVRSRLPAQLTDAG
ncbi:hypothetical protein FHW79_000527 [Azospirillum sp. OGB3]|uniref:hypothetical protein n=1 Tax=Azospirillum sp. OGB3 TaxID=2587012 RepID=UPI00160574B4|nr:hypothetical protein [Azospirillum sp. OGB3]MBB3262940.1 hypothetical protein [Azospirillum sp. OGB3]